HGPGQAVLRGGPWQHPEHRCRHHDEGQRERLRELLEQHRDLGPVTDSAVEHGVQGDADGVSLHHVSKTYWLATVLQVEDLVFPFGKVVGLVGENGAGKSTLLGILAGTVTPNPGGEVSISGEVLATGSPIASQAA